MTVRTPWCTHHGLGSSAFARRYLRNHFCFLFLRLLRCFSSPGSLRTPMDSVYDDMTSSCRVSPFRYLRITACLRLPEAFRSLSRLSSALSAKASALRPFLLNLLLDLREFLHSQNQFCSSGLLFSFTYIALYANSIDLRFLCLFWLVEHFRVPLSLLGFSSDSLCFLFSDSS